MVSGLITRTPSSSPPRRQISANRDISWAFDTVLDDGMMVVKNNLEFVYGMISCTVPPIALRKIWATTGGSVRPVAWLGATSATSFSATPKLVQRKPSGSRISVPRISRISLPVAAYTISRTSGPQVSAWYMWNSPGRYRGRNSPSLRCAYSWSSARVTSGRGPVGNGSPALCVITCRMVIRCLPWLVKVGM